MELLVEAPLLLPTAIDRVLNVTTYEGFIDIGEKSFYVKLQAPHDKISNACFECEWELQRLLQPKLSLIQERLKKSENLAMFWKEFKLIAENCLQDRCLDQEILSEKCEVVLQQVQEVTNGKLVFIDNTFTTLEFEVCDQGERTHKIKIEFNKEDMNRAPVCTTDLPKEFDFHWSAKCRLKHLVEQFESVVDSYQEFWDVLKDIDEKCWILEPEAPTFAAAHRRIALGSNLSLHITVNCLQPKTLPECRFFGADSATGPLKERLNINLHLWDVERSLLNNLQEVLTLDFPSPMHSSATELTVDCGICYCLHMNEEIPDIVCEDKRCAQAFHRSCLYEWLRNLASRQSFDTIFGECPFCNHPIRVKKYA